ncbi:membrane protein [Mycolicibacterium neoaurum]|uniref:Transmembrane protein n=1 Tax=Mycolicibacterium neoaurum TaxID=1795 RepID=A0AAV2WSQ0_MYCNE|nr:membrane protein [Mycolicibacterium neoaurum]TLH59175.1 DUF3093 domain-containing protein [Mycolicibacterium neoaurum]CDQ47112.1 transmembrane protein [Mycolicibacterium neoaurum]SDD05255.1 hypothetical protein SAMN04488581_1755 [Mycolicibacterium neoaurum]
MTEDEPIDKGPTEPRAEQVLFHEPGGTWWWLLAGPIAGLAMALIQVSGGAGWRLGVPAVFCILVSGFLAIQIKAARIHTSVELTPTTLRQGTERIPIADIVQIYPELKRGESEKWQTYRAFGELSGIPRGRTGIGIKLTDKRTGQAWARKHRTLRTALVGLVEEQMP